MWWPRVPLQTTGIRVGGGAGDLCPIGFSDLWSVQPPFGCAHHFRFKEEKSQDCLHKKKLLAMQQRGMVTQLRRAPGPTKLATKLLATNQPG
jgi:hypothetical protein